MVYVPDKWVVVKITDKSTGKYHYRVFANWVGGFARGDSWKMNSGISVARIEDYHYAFEGYSGSTYLCAISTYGTTLYGAGVLKSLISNSTDVIIEELEYQNFLELNYD